MSSKLVQVLYAFVICLVLINAKKIDSDDIDINSNQNGHQKQHGSKISREQRIALNRDWYARENPDELLYGFCPIWAIGMLFISGSFLVLALISGISYVLGCKRPDTHKASKRKASTSFVSSDKSVQH